MEVQIFGRKSCQATRKTLRFFTERRIRTHFVDVDRKPPSARELDRFARRFGADALIDRDSPRYAELGLKASHLSAVRLLERARDEPRLLRTPLVRWKSRVAVGHDEDSLRSWLREEAGSD